MDLPLSEADRLAKLVPDRPGIELGRVLRAPFDGDGSLKQKENLNSDEIANVKQLREILESGELTADVLREAEKVEGSVRGTGVHAAGIIIAPSDLTDIIPVCTSKESTLLLTQYDGKVIEDAGVIKMDFLGLKTLTIIRDALRMIDANHGIRIDIDGIPLDDAKTYELYQKSHTNGTFQFESAGMQKYLRELKADRFGDLIAMNALFRPGPLEYIPTFIKRKHGLEKITYDLPEMEDLLKETYGVTVYQEQVMLLSQKLAGFSKGDADVLRKAMGKKDRATLDKMKGKFLEGTAAKGLDPKVCAKVWTDWEAFAQYAFNKSHSTCYAFVAYQTAWLKANYPAEYMSSVLTHSGGQIDKITFFMEECRRMGIQVLGPDVNESALQFGVNKEGKIRFGLGAVKGVGEAAVDAMIESRKKDGPFTSIYDVVRRVNLRAANRKALESLAYAGAFDSLKVQRAHFFHSAGEGKPNWIETLTRYGQQHQDGADSSQVNMFGEADNAAGHIHAGLALQAERLKREGVLRTAPQQVAAAAETERDIAADAAIVAGEVAAADTAGRRMNGPGEAGVLGDAEIDAEAGDMRQIRLGPAAFAAEDAFKRGRGRDHHADVLAAMAFEHTDAHGLRLLRIRGCERGDESHGSGSEEG
jgi:DNA polymerase-3 subunit alpha